jgi:diguanylate cyclase (GGDEF)-like protein/PAS domain S-box-containing protein
MNEARLTGMLGGVLVALGSAVMAGWLLHIKVLTQTLPGLTSMVFNTAACFVLLGSALLFQMRQPQRRHWVIAASSMTLILATLNFLQISFEFSLGIDQPDLHHWAQDGNSHPGRMSGITTICFLLASSNLLLMAIPRQQSQASFRAGRAMSAILGLIGLVGLSGYVLKLELLYSWYPFSKMALHTAVGMMLLAAALWLAWRDQFRGQAAAQDEQILDVSFWTLVLVAALSALVGVGALKVMTDEALLNGLRLSHQARVESLATILDLRTTRAAVVSSNLPLRALLQAASSDAGQGKGKIRDDALADISRLLPYGFSSVVLLARDGSPLAGAGAPVSAPEMSLPIKTQLPLLSELLWKGGFYLRTRAEIRNDDTAIGYVETEQRLPAIDAMMQSAPEIGQSGELELCGVRADGLICFPDRGNPRPYRPLPAPQSQALPIQMAEQGGQGVGSFRDRAGALVMAAYAPVNGSGLYSSLQLKSAVFYVPLRNRLLWGSLIVLLVATLGGAMLRGRLRPLLRKVTSAEQRQRGILESLQEGVVLQDATATVLSANAAAERILGISGDALRKQSPYDRRWQAIREDGSDLPATEHPVSRTLRTGVAESGIVVGLKEPDGQVAWLSVNTVPIMLAADAGNVAVVSSFSDITQRRAAEEALRLAEQRFRLMVDVIADYAIFMLDPEGLVTTWNLGAEQMMGYTAEEIIGRHFSCLFSEEDVRAGKAAAELAAATVADRYETQGWRVRKDGSRLWEHVVVTAVRDSAGTLVGFAKVARDLTDRRRADELVADANRFREAILEASPFAIIATDTDGTIRNFNLAAEKMLWYRREEMIGKLTPAVIHDAQEVVQRAAELSGEFNTLIEPGFEVFVFQSRRGIVEEREWTYVRKDGSRFPVNLAVTALRNAAGEVTGFLGIAYDIAERKRREEYTQHVAQHDGLTGLPNRALLNDRLAQAIQVAMRSGNELAVLMVDLDHFKRVNDSLGHHVGDELLKQVAQRLLACVRGSDTVARMGGDEFVVLLPEAKDRAVIEKIAANIVQSVSVPIIVGAHELTVTPSVGVSFYPADGRSANALLKNADMAMYCAKAAGRAAYRVFNQDMELIAIRRMEGESELRKALLNNEFVMHYQPQVCLKTGSIIGMEALIRWQHPTRGVVPPAEFIPLAEETGQIVQIGEWVLRTACREALELQQRIGREIKLSINFSPRQFHRENLREMIASVIRESGFNPRCLEIEITEGILMEDVDEARKTLDELRELGVAIAVDDFGTGYSSFAYITRFRINTLKIDQSFISKMSESAEDYAVVHAIIAMARSLSLAVVAEGVETSQQLQMLRKLDCDAAQGFLLGKAVPMEAFSTRDFPIGD